MTPLHYAVLSGSFEITRLLVENHSDLNTPDLEGKTPLHNASQNGMKALFDFIIPRNST